jgi:hypothetical protein
MGGRGSVAGRALWLGGLGYAVYNAPFYLFGAALNAFLPLYALAFVVAAWALVHYLVTAWADILQPAPGRQRLSGGYLVFVAAGLSAVWIGLWAAHVFAGMPIATGTEAFKIVAAIDLTTLVPALGLGGVLLWTGHEAGPVIGGGAATMGALYLCVLLTNSLVLWFAGHAEGPGEAPIWAALLAGTLIAAAAILRRLPPGARRAA